VRVEFRRAAGDVQRGDACPLDGVEAVPHRLARHHLDPIRAGIDVAVPARLVADLADVHREDIEAGRA
jgi:hypothetical protein